MKSFELLRAAATLILEGGWTTAAGDAADAEGNSIELWVTGSTETGRAAPNPAAVKFSIYGAIVTALHRNGGRLEDPAAMWTLLGKRAAEINNVPHGGDNFVHPIRQFNATQTDPIKVLAFLGRCADELEGAPGPEPLEVRAIPRLTEPMTAVDVYRLGPKSIAVRQAHLTAEEVRALPRLTEPAPFDRVALGPHPSEPMQIARALKAAIDAPQAPIPPMPPATLREVFDAVLDPNAKPLPPALTIKDVQDLHSTLAVPIIKLEPDNPATAEMVRSPVEAEMVRIAKEPKPYKPMTEGLKAAVGPRLPVHPMTINDPARPFEIDPFAAERTVWTEPALPAGVEITGITPPVLLPYKPMLTTRSLREEHQPALYSGPELNMKGMPNPFGGDDEQH